MSQATDATTRNCFPPLLKPLAKSGPFRQSRFQLLLFFFQLFALYGFLVRLALTIRSWPQISHSPLHLFSIFALGVFYDLACSFYWSIPLTLYLILFPAKGFSTTWHRWILNVGLFCIIYILGFSAVAEWLFWDEFGVRLNFIAVDYLVYTTEVLGNIRESYPVPLLLGLIFLAAGAFYLLLRCPFNHAVQVEAQAPPPRFRKRLLHGTAFLLLPALTFIAIDGSHTELLSNRYEKELAADGVYQLFAAFRNNTLDYKTFYPTMDDHQVFTELRHQLKTDNATFLQPAPVEDITRAMAADGKEKRHNVVLVMMESMGAEFLGVFDNQQAMTPNLDQLAREGLLFTNLYATGTRTVRGMEAVTLSVPPTPGRSIVKRPDNQQMFSMGEIFRAKGYDNKFLYGGYGYFDNMNAFFNGNGFAIVDRNSLTKEEITFANVWGVCDEDIYMRAVKEFDASHQAGKPFFGFLMTTSNHRPYTYPDGKIDVPSHTGRVGGVKYADYAIGAFLREARRHPWFDDTIFVFVADHCAASAGRQELPVYRYHIPLILYAPKIIAPGTITSLASQIDVAPTLLGLLNWNYHSKFFGKDILRPDFTPRALIGNYEKLGYIRDGVLTLLTERDAVHQYRIAKETLQDTVLDKIDGNDPLRRQAISYYQGASFLNKHRLDRWE